MDSPMQKKSSLKENQNITPIRRLGLSRRFSPMARFTPPLLSKKLSDTTSPIPNSPCSPPLSSINNIKTPSRCITKISQLNLSASKPTEIETEKDQENEIKNLEEKLKTVQDVKEIEESIKMWSKACKEGLIALHAHFIENGTKITRKEVCYGLGIWDFIKDNIETGFIENPDNKTEK